MFLLSAVAPAECHKSRRSGRAGVSVAAGLDTASRPCRNAMAYRRPWSSRSAARGNPDSARRAVRTKGAVEQRDAVERAGHGQRLAETARTGAQTQAIGHASPHLHGLDPVGGFQCAQQHGGARFGTTDKVQAPVQPVAAIDIGVARRPEHHGVADRRATERVRGRVGAVIRFRSRR